MDVERSARHRELEARESALTPEERQELDNLQSAYSAMLAADDEDAELHNGEYLPHTIDYGYHPTPMSPEARTRFVYMKASAARRGKPQLKVCQAYDVPPWIVLDWYPEPRFPRLRWALRRVWRFHA